MIVSKYISSALKNAKRIITVTCFGKNDHSQASEAMPFGVDANPIAGMHAIYSYTSMLGQPVIIGYINTSQLASAGEMRLYATDGNGAIKGYTWLKADGTYEILGNDDNMVRYSKLETAFNELKSDLNSLISKFNSHTHILTLSSGTGTAAPTATTDTPSTADITPAKITRIKTIGSDS